MEQISKVINYEFSETDDFVDITTRLSYMDDYNANGFKLETNEDISITDKSVKSLINTPLVAYYNSKKDDFEGHKVVKTKEGVKFGTQAVGTHTEAWLQTDKVTPVFSKEEVELPCIYGKARIWASRFPKFYNVLKKRLEKNNMYTSWELTPTTLKEESDNDSIEDARSSDEWTFLGNCLLGDSKPAYGKSSKVIEISSTEDMDVELSEALQQDIIALSDENNNENNEESTDDKDNINKEKDEGGEGYMGKKEENKETSAITDNDLYSKVRRAINSTNEDKYYYMAMLYPYEYKAIAYDNWDRESQSDFVEFSYAVNSDETISITSQKDVEMVFIPKSEFDVQVSEVQAKLEDAEKQISEAGKGITDLTKEKEDLEVKISELNVYKEKVEEMERAENERELAEKKVELKTFTLEDSLIAEEELESDENISTIFSELTLENYSASQDKIEVIKGRRAIQNLKASRNEKKDESETLETSETKSTNKAKTSLNDDENDSDLGINKLSAIDAVRSMLSSK